MTKYVLIGEGESVDLVERDRWETTYYEENVATFDTKELAEDYIEKSRLRQRKRVTYGSDDVFRNKSMLCRFVDARIEIYEEEELENNPTL